MNENEGKKERKKGEKRKIDKGEKYEKQGIGEQGGGEKLTKRRERKMRGESFSDVDKKKETMNKSR